MGTIPTIPDFTAGEFPTAAKFDQIGTALSFLLNPPACSVMRSANQLIANGVETVIAFDAEEYDTDGMHSLVTNNSRVTIQTPGKYLVTGGSEFQGTGDGGRRYCAFYVNGDRLRQTNPPAATVGDDGAYLSMAMAFVEDDYIEMFVFQDSGDAIDVRPRMEVTFVAA